MELTYQLLRGTIEKNGEFDRREMLQIMNVANNS